MNHEVIKDQKVKDQQEYMINIQEEREKPNHNILQAPDNEFIKPMDIKEYK